MSDAGFARKAPQQELLGELILPALAVGLALYYFRSVAGLPWIARAHGLVVGAAVLILTAALGGRLLLRLWQGTAAVSFSAMVERLGVRRAERWLLVVWMAGLIAVMPSLGFTVTVFLFVALSARTLGVRQWSHLVGLGAVTACVGYLLFVAFLGVKLPVGPVDRWLGGLFAR